VHDTTPIKMGEAIANLAKASVTGEISIKANLMKMNEADQMQTTVPMKANDTRVLFVATYLPISDVQFADQQHDLND